MLPERIPIADGLSYWKTSREPLSADIAVWKGRENTWLFDVGNGPEALACLQSLPGPKRAVLSHFHQDHTGNWRDVAFETLYQGAYTFRHTGTGEVIRGSARLEDGAAIRLFEIPSSHAKGCLGMEINGTYALLGDAVYCTNVRSRPAYNATLLQDTIRTLEGLSAPWFLLSHGEPFVRPREEILGELREIYARREKNCPYIFVD